MACSGRSGPGGYDPNWDTHNALWHDYLYQKRIRHETPIAKHQYWWNFDWTYPYIPRD